MSCSGCKETDMIVGTIDGRYYCQACYALARQAMAEYTEVENEKHQRDNKQFSRKIKRAKVQRLRGRQDVFQGQWNLGVVEW